MVLSRCRCSVWLIDNKYTTLNWKMDNGVPHNRLKEVRCTPKALKTLSFSFASLMCGKYSNNAATQRYTDNVKQAKLILTINQLRNHRLQNFKNYATQSQSEIYTKYRTIKSIIINNAFQRNRSVQWVHTVIESLVKGPSKNQNSKFEPNNAIMPTPSDINLNEAKIYE